MTWQTLLFAHWPMDPGELQRRIPAPLTLDTFDGTGWIGLIPFTMPRFSSTMLPWIGASFHECNVRTYVRYRGRPGVYFFSLDAAHRFAVWGGKRFFRLPYHFARIDLRQDRDVVHYSVQRNGVAEARMRCVWRPGEPRPESKPGGLDHFLTERYALYTVDRRGRPMCGRILHEPWSLREAQLIDLDDGLIGAAGLPVPDTAPALYHADQLDVEAWSLERS